MSISAVKSKPTYEPIKLDPNAQEHFFVVSRVGLSAVFRCLDVPADSLRVPIRIHAVGCNSADLQPLKISYPLVTIQLHETDDDLFQSIKRSLELANMGIRLYVVGSEIFIWNVSNLAAQFGLSDGEIQRELQGSLARRVFCTHCREIADAVHSNLIQCQRCKEVLFVRDHFSRRFNAYMGVKADAEVHGEFPPLIERREE